MSSSSSLPTKKIFNVLLLLVGMAAMLYFWLWRPHNELLTVDAQRKEAIQAKAKHKGAFALKAFLSRLTRYQRAARSPLMYIRARRAMLLDLQNNINPVTISGSFRKLLREGSLSDWKRASKEWQEGLATLESKLPEMPLRYLRVFLAMFQDDQENLRRWSEERKELAPQKRQELLTHIWLGHAAFWRGALSRAQRHYQWADVLFSKHPGWRKYTKKNWRLPTEWFSMHYHSGLIALLQKQPKRAVAHFRALIDERTKTQRNAHKDKLLYLSLLWGAEAAQRAALRPLAHKWLQIALTFRPDPTLAQLALARHFETSSPQRAALWRQRVIQSRFPQRYSYTESHLLARAQQLIHTPNTKDTKTFFALLRRKPWPHQLRALQSKDTRKSRFFPAPDTLYKRLQTLPIPKIITKSTSRPTTSPTSTQTSKPDSSGNTAQEHRRSLRLLHALGLMKRFAYKEARGVLQTIIQKTPKAPAPHAYLGLLALQQGSCQQAQVHFRHALSLQPKAAYNAYMAYTSLCLGQKKQAQRWLKTLKSSPKWYKTIGYLMRLQANKTFKASALKRVSFWRWMMSYRGMLTKQDSHLLLQARVWCLYPQIRGKQHEAWQIFRSWLVSDKSGSRWSLSTLLRKSNILEAHYRRLKKPKHVRRYRTQRTFLSRLLRAFPHQRYLLEQTYYSHQWGIVSLQLD